MVLHLCVGSSSSRFLEMVPCSNIDVAQEMPEVPALGVLSCHGGVFEVPSWSSMTSKR